MNLFKKLLLQSKDIFFLQMKPIAIISFFCLLIVYQLTNLFNELVARALNNPLLNGSIKITPESLKTVFTPEAVKLIFIALSIIFLIFLILTLIQYFFSAMFLKTIHRVDQNLITNTKKIFKTLPKIFAFILLESIFIIIGLILFIIPGILMYFVFYFAFIIMITENKGIFQSIAKGFSFFKSKIWQILPIIIVLKVLLILIHPLAQWIGMGGIALITNMFLSVSFGYYLLNDKAIAKESSSTN